MSEVTAQPGVDRIDVEAVSRKARPSLYAARVKIFPKRAEGYFRRLKWWVMAVTLAIYWLTPWIRWDRGSHAPDQAVLVDLANRRFYFFFIEIWPQEFYYVAGLLIMAGLGLFLVTSVMGRAWCGYACPQTVWTDLFIAVEQIVEGDRNARIRLDKAPWTFEKIRKRATVHALWLVISVATGGAWIFYFADAPTLITDFVRLDAAPVAYATVGLLTATTYVLAGFMREQVCNYMCPWPRIQGAMLDEHSLLVTYHAWRGEPRARGQKRVATAAAEVGDCVDCNACIAVCPMGIDIRDGDQLACITCALCIDACDDIMGRLGRPKELISYTTLSDYNAHAASAKTEGRAAATAGQRSVGIAHIVRPRTLFYAAAWAMIGLTMAVMLGTRDRLDINALPDRNPLYVRLSDGSIRNGYTIKILNMTAEPRSFMLTAEDLPGASLRLAGAAQDSSAPIEVEVGPDRLREIKVFVSRPTQMTAPGTTRFSFVVQDTSGPERARETTEFYAPET